MPVGKRISYNPTGTWEELGNKGYKDNKGYYTKIVPVTKILLKAMVPVNNFFLHGPWKP